VNRAHLELLASPQWRRYLEVDVIPWVRAQADLGGDVLEVGPGPGLTTDLLRHQGGHVVAVESDPVLAAELAQRLDGTSVDVVCGDATEPFPWAERFDVATCFTMLHHVPTPARQDALFAEVCRTVRPGGVFVGIDSSDAPELRALHVDDVFVPIDASTLGARLESAGFDRAVVESWTASTRPGPRIRFVASRLRDPGVTGR
jgi:SAM-dependent methyltransferase